MIFKKVKFTIWVLSVGASMSALGEESIYCVMQDINDPIGEKCANEVVVIPKNQVVRWCRFDQEIIPLNRQEDRRIGLDSGVACVALAKPRKAYVFPSRSKDAD